MDRLQETLDRLAASDRKIYFLERENAYLKSEIARLQEKLAQPVIDGRKA